MSTRKTTIKVKRSGTDAKSPFVNWKFGESLRDAVVDDFKKQQTDIDKLHSDIDVGRGDLAKLRNDHGRQLEKINKAQSDLRKQMEDVLSRLDDLRRDVNSQGDGHGSPCSTPELVPELVEIKQKVFSLEERVEKSSATINDVVNGNVGNKKTSGSYTASQLKDRAGCITVEQFERNSSHMFEAYK